MPQTLPCENGAGSINNPAGSVVQSGANNPALKPYVAPQLPIGSWEISGLAQDECAQGDQFRQETYVAEALNISGAPINLFKLLGVHEQGNGSVLSQGKLIGSTSYPGYPLSGINSTSWKSFQSGSAVLGTAYVGIDFGNKLMPAGDSTYKPEKAKWTKVGAINITQANTPNEFARQVKVEIADGTCYASSALFAGTGNGTLTVSNLGASATQSFITVSFLAPDRFSVYATLPDGTVISLETGWINKPFFSTFVNFTINSGITPYAINDMFSFTINYEWKRLGLYNLTQSPLVQTLGFKTPLTVKAVKVTPTMFTGTGSWEVLALDFLDSAPTDINNIQDLFFNENRDRDYSLEPVLLKVQYSPTDSLTDLSRFGLSILDSYSFTVSFVAMIQSLGRPVVVGDIIEVIPELQYDQNLKPIRKFLEVTDTGWAAEGFSTSWRPTVYRFSASQAMPSQETRDIFGTIDTQKYLLADSVLNGGVGEQIDVTPLTTMEEIMKEASDAVPETGSNDQRETRGTKAPAPAVTPNAKGQPTPSAALKGKQNIYIEDGLPPDDQPYGEGYALPDAAHATDGQYFRLYYQESTHIAPRLYRFSAPKNRWIYLETDRRGDYSSHKPSVRNILQSSTQQSLGKKI